MHERLNVMLNRAKYAAIGAAIGAGAGALINRKFAKLGGALGGFVGATIGEKRVSIERRIDDVRSRYETEH